MEGQRGVSERGKRSEGDDGERRSEGKEKGRGGVREMVGRGGVRERRKGEVE